MQGAIAEIVQDPSAMEGSLTARIMRAERFTSLWYGSRTVLVRDDDGENSDFRDTFWSLETSLRT